MSRRDKVDKKSEDWCYIPGEAEEAPSLEKINSGEEPPAPSTPSEEEEPKGHPLIVVMVTVMLLAAMSLMPWGRLTGNRMKDFNLLEDLFPGTTARVTDELIDPELEAAMAEQDSEMSNMIETDGAPSSIQDNARKVTDRPSQSMSEPVVTQPSRINGMMAIEDYTPAGLDRGIQRLGRIMAQAQSRPVRIAFLGDSYIEGDIFTQDVRRLLQDEYGGNGVGYMAMHSEFPGFRQSVKQSSSGWESVDIRKVKSDSIKPLSGEYYVASAGATSSFTGTSRIAHADSWDKTILAYISSGSGEITFKVNDTSEEIYDVVPSDNIQFITLAGTMTKVDFSTTADGLRVLGIWLCPSRGVTLDCMSLRGNSGLSHRKLSRKTAREMSQQLPYDLIVLEYGINALSSSQEDYTPYSDLMVRVVNEIKAAYPGAEILMLGIGDRGQKAGSEVKSIPTAAAMVNAQRRAARRAGIMFWDTREAMGGEDAIVDWRQRGLVNADYIHLNHKGGRELASIFVESFIRAMNR